MKKWTTLLGVLIGISAFAQPGYEIKVTFKPFKNQYIYLGHYFGKTYPIIDSAKLDVNSKAVFKGSKTLPGGIYLIGYPNKTGFFEVLVDKQQHFSIIADTNTLRKSISFVNSPDNTLFNSYQQFMTQKGTEINVVKQQVAATKDPAEKAKLENKLDQIDLEVKNYRNNIIKTNPDNILTVLLHGMAEPIMPPKWKNPKTKEDSLQAYYYFRDHFWDGVNFWDGRLAYTTFFEEKLDKYINTLMVPQPDSMIKEIDRIMSYASINEHMTKAILLKFVNRFLNQKYMWEDAVFVHLFEKYFAQQDYPWLTDQGRKTITERAYNLMSNIMGSPAADIALPDTAGKLQVLYADSISAYTVVVFWDPNCGHCKEVLPKLDSLYRVRWKAQGVKIYAVAKETDAKRSDWLDFIHSHNTGDWTNVFYSKAEDKLRTDSGVPGYSQLYDVQTFPTLYLLDKDKRIIAKKLSWEQTDDVLQVKTKGL
jgi:thiol-disulfide isomerase/thioredoxin